MWFAASSAYLALLSFADTWMFLYIALGLGADPTTLGVASAIWSAVFVISNVVFGKLVEDGHNKAGAAISAALLCLAIALVLGSESVVRALLAYSVLFPLSVSLGRTASSVTLLEYVDSDSWSRYNYVLNTAAFTIRGTLLILVYLGYISGYHILALSILVSAIYAIVLPPVVMPLERTLFKVSKQLGKLHGYLKFVDVLPEVIEGSLTSSQALELRWEVGTDVPSYRPLLAAFVLVASSDALFVVLPLILSGSVGKLGTFLIYGISSIASAVAMLVLARVGSGRLVTLASGVARALVLPSVLFVGGVSMGVAYMVVMSVLFNTFNTSNYNNYLNSSSGQSTYLYWVLSELGSILGSLIGGYVASYYGFTYVVAVSVAGHLIASLLA